MSGTAYAVTELKRHAATHSLGICSTAVLDLRQSSQSLLCPAVLPFRGIGRCWPDTDVLRTSRGRAADWEMEIGMDISTELLTTAEVAVITRAPIATVRYWRHLGTGPRSFRVGRRVVYRRSEVE
jgi:hypothetical protein